MNHPLPEHYTVSTDKSLINTAFVHGFLSNSYWAAGISLDIVERSIEGSLSFGVYYKDTQVGFARVITDSATFAYLADVFIDEAHRGKGLSKSLVAIIMDHPSLQGLRRFMLATRDAHGLYAQYGFEPLTLPDRWMQRYQPYI